MLYFFLVWSFCFDEQMFQGEARFNTQQECDEVRDEFIKRMPSLSDQIACVAKRDD